jgi:GntR family transcriptional regulator
VNIAAKPATPKYRLVAKALRGEIEAGTWLAGARMPAEQDLMKRFDVAHMTIRQAVSSIVEEGVLQPVQGRGWVARSCK